MATTVTFKRGTTFAVSGTYTPGAGPATLAGVTITSDVIDAAGSTYSLTPVILGGNLTFTLTYADDSADWALGLARWDLKFVYSGSVFYSETLRVNVIDQVTA